MQNNARNHDRCHALYISSIIAFFLASLFSAYALDFTIQQIADESYINRDPVISETGLIAWNAFGRSEETKAQSDIVAYHDHTNHILTADQRGVFFGSVKPQAFSNSLVWVASFVETRGDITWVLQEVAHRDEPVPELPAQYTFEIDSGGHQTFQESSNTTIEASAATTNHLPENTNTNMSRRRPSGMDEICFWQIGSEIKRITHDSRHDLAPSAWGNTIAWQIERGWPFGWEIMLSDNGTMKQLTTNFYYDMAPKAFGNNVTWYGWDGHDFEIFLYKKDQDITIQITSNQFDDVSPVLQDNLIAWEGYPAAESDIFIWDGNQPRKISDNIEDDFNPRVWNGQVVWQGFDGDDFEIYLFDGEKTIKLTSNLYDDTNPDIRDDLICWMGHYENWDAEIFVWDGTGEPTRLTDNEIDDRDPKTAGKQIVWQTEVGDKSQIFLATPK